MSKMKIDKNDVLFFESFLQQKDADFVIQLNFRYEMDYLFGLGMKFLKKCEDLKVELVDLQQDIKNKIEEYINQYGNVEDRIYYLKQQLAYLILCKYYNSDGKMKIELISSQVEYCDKENSKGPEYKI